MSQERPIAALAPTKVSPFTEKGRSPAEDMTGGGGPPRAPVNFWTFVTLAAVLLLAAGAAPLLAVPLSDSQPCQQQKSDVRAW